MTQTRLAMTEWLELNPPSTEDILPEFAKTCGNLSFLCNGKPLMANIRGENTYTQTACLPAYPLAFWIAQSWWRLLFEPAQSSRDAAWSATHCMRSAGGGFLWPDIWFTPDGINVLLSARAYKADSQEPFEYLPCTTQRVAVEELETCLAAFVESALEKLSMPDSDLSKLWREICRERDNSRLARLRKAEAILGYDPDDYAEEAIEAIMTAAQGINEESLWELLAGIRLKEKGDPARIQAEMEMLCATTEGIQADFSSLAIPEPLEWRDMTPWDAGWRLAAALRKEIGITQGVTDQALCDMARIASRDFISTNSTASPLAIGKHTTGTAYRLTSLEGRHESLRFQLARYTGAYLLQRMTSGSPAPWLVLSDGTTFQQKAQRAFGAELLLPFELLQERTDGNYTPEAVSRVARDFDVSPLLAASLLANHNAIPKEDLVLYAA